MAGAVITALLTSAGIAGIAAPAQAAGTAEYGVGIGYKDYGNGGEGWTGSIYVPGVGYMYCIQPGVDIGATADPVVASSYSQGYTSDSGYGNHSAFDENAAFRINYAIGNFGQLDAPLNGYSRDQAEWASATEFYVWSQVMSTYNAPWGSYDTWNSLKARTGSSEAAVRAKIDTIAAAAAAATPSEGTGSGGSGALTIDMTNYKNGFVNVSMTPADAVATLTISGATFDANGTNTIAGVQNGQSLAITGNAGVDPDNPNEKYDIAVTGSAAATVQGSGYGKSVRLSENTNSGTQSLVTVNPVTDVNVTFDLAAGAADPLIEFAPAVTTQAPEYVEIGQDFTDRVTAFVPDEGPATNPWATYTNGSYVPVNASGTLYGPFAAPPTQSATVPSGAPVAGTAEISLNGPGTYTANAGASTASGYYTWVWEIDGADQGPVAQMLIGEDFSFVDDFGQTVETSLSPMEPTATSQVSKEIVATGEQVTDTLTVDANGLWMDGTEATFEGTAYAVPSGTPPVASGTVPSNAVAIDTVEITANAPGTYTSPEVTVPDDAGYVVWVWTFDAASQSDPTRFSTGYTWSDNWGVASETSRVMFEPVVTTKVVNGFVETGEEFNDVLTSSVVKGQWLNGTNVVANGTLYGPMLTAPTESATVPAGTPVAGTTTQTLTGVGDFTTDSDIVAAAAGYYTWVWTIDGASQSAGTQALIGADYAWADAFGQTVETSLTPMEPEATSQVSQAVVTTGSQVTDTLTVTNGNGGWLDGVEATFQGTAYAVLSGTPPTESGSVPTENVRVIDTVEITANAPGTYTSPEVTVPDDAGYVVWVWRFDASKQSDPTKFRTGYTWSDNWGIAAETSRVLFEPAVSTVVASEFVQSGETFNDVLTAYAAKGQWIDGTEVVANGTLYGPMLAIPEESDTAPSWAPIAGTATQTLTHAGEFTTDSDIVSLEAGYYTWVWEIHASDQSEKTQGAIPADYSFIDRFAQEVETSITPSQVVATSKVVKSQVALGEGFQDTIEVSLANGSGGWLQANRQRIPVTFTGTAYWVEGATAPVQQDAVPADAVVVAETSIVASGPGTYESAVIPGEDYRKGFVTWVWKVDPAAQPTEFQGYIKEWSDAFGIAEETTEVLIPEVATKAQETVAIGETFTDTATVTGTMPIPGADLHFELYAATKDDAGNWVCEAGNLLWTSESTHITTTGEYVSPEAPGQLPGTYHWVEVLVSENGNEISRGECGIPNETTTVVPPTVTTKAQTNVPVGDTFTDTATVTGPVPSSEEHALDLHFELYAATKDEAGNWVCEAGNLLWTSETQTVWGREGDYVSPEAPFQNVGDYHWVEVLTAPEFGGAEIHRGECGIPDETTTVVKPEVTTKAQPATKLGGTVFDIATVTGPIAKDGYDLTFAAYAVPTDADGNVLAPEGTAEGDFSWMADTEPIYVTTEPVRVTAEGEYQSDAFTPTDYAKIFWVETLSFTPKDAPEGTEPTIVHQGEFGVRLETSFVVDITTQAQERGIAGGNATDTAIVNGFVPDGSTITFSAYKVPVDAAQAPNAQDVCTADNLIATTEPVEVPGGRHDGTKIESAAVTLPDQAEDYKVYWIEETHDELGNTISKGVCGEPSETTTVEGSGGDLAWTGGSDQPAWILGVFVLVLAAAGTGIWAVRRRQNA